jgi:anti-sigma B factor antagonist
VIAVPDYSVRLTVGATAAGDNMAHIEMQSGVVRASGDLDLESADVFVTLGCAAVQQCNDSSIVIDLSECTFLDSSGVGALVTVRNAARDAGMKIFVQGASDRVKRVLEVTGLMDCFPEPDAHQPTDITSADVSG